MHLIYLYFVFFLVFWGATFFPSQLSCRNNIIPPSPPIYRVSSMCYTSGYEYKIFHTYEIFTLKYLKLENFTLLEMVISVKYKKIYFFKLCFLVLISYLISDYQYLIPDYDIKKLLYIYKYIR